MRSQEKSFELKPRALVIVGVLAILYGSLKHFDDPRLQAVFLSSGVILLAFGAVLFLATMENPKSRLGIWIIAIQLLGAGVFIELSLRVDLMYLLGVAGVLAAALNSIAVARGEIKFYRGP